MRDTFNAEVWRFRYADDSFFEVTADDLAGALAGAAIVRSRMADEKGLKRRAELSEFHRLVSIRRMIVQYTCAGPIWVPLE